MIEEQMQELADRMAIKEIPLDEGWRLLHATVLLECAVEVGPNVQTEVKKTEMVRDIKEFLYGPIHSEIKHVKCLVDGCCPLAASDKLQKILEELKS